MEHPPLLTPLDVERELLRLFDAGPQSGLRIRIWGEDGGPLSPSSAESLRELLASLKMHDEDYHEPGELLVPPPGALAIRRALMLLEKEEHQKRLLNRVLTTFGHRLIDPLAAMLEVPPDGELSARLCHLRESFLSQVRALRLTRESQQMLLDDVGRLLSDEYLALLADHEERVQRPQVTRLAQQVLHLVGVTFHGALQRWQDNVERLADRVVRQQPGRVLLKELPLLLHSYMTAAIEDFLWTETNAELSAALAQLFAEHRSIVPEVPPPLGRDLYQELAEACWQIISDHC